MIHFFVAGTPITQGSKTAFVTRDGKRAVMREGGSTAARGNHVAWRHAVATEARAAAARELPDGPLEGPVSLVLAFTLHRPASAPKRRRTWPTGARSGDLDKLERAVLDAITGVLIVDDSQVVRMPTVKDYGSAPGVRLSLYVVDREMVPVPPGLRYYHCGQLCEVGPDGFGRMVDDGEHACPA